MTIRQVAILGNFAGFARVKIIGHFESFEPVKIMGHFCRLEVSQDYRPIFASLARVKNFDKTPLVKTVYLNKYY